MRADNKTIAEQVKFCKELMDRLNRDVTNIIPTATSNYNFPYSSRVQNDVVRLRRELLILGQMTDYRYVQEIKDERR